MTESYCDVTHRIATRSSKFTIRMSRDSYNHLKRHLLDRKQNILLNIVQEHLFIDGWLHTISSYRVCVSCFVLFRRFVVRSDGGSHVY